MNAKKNSWSTFHFSAGDPPSTLSDLLHSERLRNRLFTLESVLEKAMEEVRLLRAELLHRSADGATYSSELDAGTLSALDASSIARQRQRLFTEGGTTKGIKEKIKKVLETRKEPMTSAQIAEAIYVPDPRVSFDLFKRRVIVATSSMHKDEIPPQVIPSNHKGTGREIFWTLPSQCLAVRFDQIQEHEERVKAL